MDVFKGLVLFSSFFTIFEFPPVGDFQFNTNIVPKLKIGQSIIFIVDNLMKSGVKKSKN